MLSILCFSTVSFAEEMPQGRSRIRLRDLEESLLGVQARVLRFSGNASQELVGRCQESQILKSASCEALTPSAVFGFSPHEESNHVVLTQTQIVTKNNQRHAECRAVNLRFDETVRLSMSLQCAPADLAQAVRN